MSGPGLTWAKEGSGPYQREKGGRRPDNQRARQLLAQPVGGADPSTLLGVVEKWARGNIAKGVSFALGAG